MAAHKYAIFFPEGEGFLYCQFLGAGRSGSVCAVRSIVDNKDYVRKKTRPCSGNAPHMFDRVQNPEIEYHRDHPQIPQLVHSQQHHPLPRTHRLYEEFMSSSMYFSYCNGGTLSRLLAVFERERILAPEVFVLHLIDQLLGVTLSLHQRVDGVPSVVHQDIHHQNVFLHFPTEDSQLPDFFLGDFDGARKIHDSVWEASKASLGRKMRNLKDIKEEDAQNKLMAEFALLGDELPPQNLEAQVRLVTNDLSTLAQVIQIACIGLNQEQPGGDVLTPQVQPKLLEATLALIRELHGGMPENYNAVMALYQKFRQYAEECRQQTSPMPGFHWTRPDRYNDSLPAGQPSATEFAWHRSHIHLNNDPEALAALNGPLKHEMGFCNGQPEILLFDTRHELLHSCETVPGPWKIARICPDTSRVLAVERLDFNSCLPSYFDIDPDYQETNPNADELDRDYHDDLDNTKGFMVHTNVDLREHQALERQFGLTEVDSIGLKTVIGKIKQLDSSPGTPDTLRLIELDGEWNEERLARQVRLSALAGEAAPGPSTPTEPTRPGPPKSPSPTSSELEGYERFFADSPNAEQTATGANQTHNTEDLPAPATNAEQTAQAANANGASPRQSPAPSTGTVSAKHDAATTPPGSPAPAAPEPPKRVIKGRKGKSKGKGKKGVPTTAAAPRPSVANTTTTHPARRPRAQPARARPNVKTRGMVAAAENATRRVTRSMAKAAAEKATRRRG